MKFVALLASASLITASCPAQDNERKGLRKILAERGNYRVAIVEMPEDVASGFERLQPRALLYRPIDTDREKVPLIVTLHGSGGGRRDIEQKRWQTAAVKQLQEPGNEERQAMVLEPQSDGTWDPASLEAMLEAVLRENADIDTNRIYCVGYSMGGKGTWEWAMHHPERFAAIIPKGFIPDLSKLDGMVDLPIWAMVGDKDSRPRVEGIPAMEKALKDLGSTKVKITVFEGANHATASGRAKDEPGVYEWLFSWQRE